MLPKISAGISHTLDILPRRHAILRPEGAVKVRVIAEAAVPAGFAGGNAAGQKLFGNQQPLLQDVPVHRGADLGVKLAQQVVFADEKGLGQIGRASCRERV